MKTRVTKWMQGFRSLLISYFCVLLFPCLLLIVFVQNIYIKQTDEYVMHVAQERLNAVSLELDALFENIDATANSIFLDSDFRGKLEPSDFMNITSIRSKLNMITLNHRYIEEIVVYQRGSEYLFSSLSSYRRDLFCNIFHFDEMGQEEFFGHLENDTLTAVNATKNNITYKVFCRSGKSYRYYTNIIFMVDIDRFRELMLEQIKDGIGMLCILDTEGNVFAIESNDSDFNAEYYEDIIQEARKQESYDTESGSAIIYEGGNTYVISEMESVLSGYRFMLVISQDPLSSQIRTQKMLWITLVVLLFLSGTVCVLYLSILIYKPIKQIKERAERVYTTDPTKERGVYDIISGSLEYLEEKSSLLQVQMNTYQKYLIGKLLRNELRKSEEDDLICNMLCFNPHDSILYVNLVETDCACSEKEVMEYLFSCKVVPNHFVVKQLEQDIHFAVIWTVRKEDEQMMDVQFDAIQRTGGTSKIICSEKCDSLEQVSRAFIHVSVLDEMAGEEKGIFRVDDEIRVQFPEDACSEIREAVNCDDWQRANESLGKLIEAGSKKELYWNLFVCMYMANILSTVRAYWMNSAERVDVFMILKNRSMSFCDSYLREISGFFERESERHIGRDQSSTPVIEKMKQYLVERYNDPNFSFQEMAEEYSMSLPALSKYFNDKCGRTINDYVTELKINRAKYLLKNTDIGIAEIGLEVGYYNAGSFSRRFRQVTGQSPAEYRKGCADNKM